MMGKILFLAMLVAGVQQPKAADKWERVAVVLLANRGVSFPSNAVDVTFAVLLPKYADGLAA